MIDAPVVNIWLTSINAAYGRSVRRSCLSTELLQHRHIFCPGPVEGGTGSAEHVHRHWGVGIGSRVVVYPSPRVGKENAGEDGFFL